MAVSFPTSPSSGDTFNVGRVKYEWSGSAWKQIASQPVSTGAEIPFIKSDGTTSDPIKLASSVIADALVNDTTPQLGGSLDVNGNAIVSTSNANIAITPNGSGSVALSKVDIGGGAIDGTIIGATTTAAISGTTGTFSGVVTGATLAGTISTAAQNSITSASSLATVGTIGTGVWQGTDVAVAHGGTGASDASTARSNLGITDTTPGGSPTHVQYNNSGAFGGSANLTFDGSTLAVTGTVKIDSVPVVNSYGPYGTGASGAVSNITDADFNGTTVAQSGTISLTSNRTIRATSTVTLSQAITVNRQSGQARGSYPVKQGGPGIPLGDTLAAVGSKGIPAPIRPGGGNASLCGGILQILASGNVVVGGTITAVGTNTTSDGGGGGGLVVIVSGGTISGSSAIDVSGGAGNGTGAAKGGSGSYSGEPGGHCGVAGAGGGALATGYGSYGAGGGGAGIINAKSGGNGDGGGGGGGGGTVDNAGSAMAGGAGGLVIRGMNKLAGGWALSWNAAGASSGGAGAYGGGGGGSYGGGTGGNGGDSGSGGGGGGGQGGGNPGTPGLGAAGAAGLYAVSSYSPYAGGAGGQGGGGAGARQYSGTNRARGAGAAGHTHGDLFKTGSGTTAESGHGGGAGGQGLGGSNTVTGGDGGNGGGAAGLVIMIAPSITYSGTVTGRHVKIEGTDYQNFIKGLLQYG